MSREKTKDQVCLAEGQVFPTNPKLTGINDNVIVAGATGSGKSVSYAEPRMLHTFDTSLVVPLAKNGLKKNYAKLFRERGYEVWDIDFSNPDRSNIGYDPFDFIDNDEGIMHLGMVIANYGNLDNRSNGSNFDPYWNESVTNCFTAVAHLLKLNAADYDKKIGFADVIDFINGIHAEEGGSGFRTNVDELFHRAEHRHHGNIASRLWKTLEGNAPRTGGCILSMLQSSVGQFASERVFRLLQKPKRVSFRELGNKKTILFITTSPMNESLTNLANLMYADMFRELFESAENSRAGHLKVPVHIICDDFACSCKILNFEKYVSIFRAAGISVSLLLQSESQVSAMYGEHAATTIINNCDTYLYMGGTDIATCRNIGYRINKPIDWVMSLPLEQVIVFRRGSRPVTARRYQTYSDEAYVKAFSKEVDDEK